MVTSRRSSIDIIGEILRLGEANKTRVMYRVNMSHTQLQFYLHYLVERGLLELRKEGRRRVVYLPTDAGLGLLAHIDQIQSVIGVADQAPVPLST